MIKNSDEAEEFCQKTAENLYQQMKAELLANGIKLTHSQHEDFGDFVYDLIWYSFPEEITNNMRNGFEVPEKK